MLQLRQPFLLPMTDLQQLLHQQLQPFREAAGWCVAFSGGLDSTVLLHALTELCRRQPCPPLRAVHIHHGLQTQADSWPEHCRAIGRQLGVPVQVVPVQVPPAASVEQAAREARYVAWSAALAPGELLLLAQHQDDQVETLLLRLLRGAGVSGLQGMPRQRPLGQGSLLRPLLTVPRQHLERYAQQQGLSWVEDPSNDSDCFDRNFLRNRMLPALAQRWPGLNTVLQRTAGHMAQAQGLLEELAQLDLQQAAVQPLPDWLPLNCLDLEAVRLLSPARQTNLLRYWLKDQTRMPDTEHWAGWQAIVQAGAAAQPLWRLQAGALVRHRQRLYWLPDAWLQELPALALLLDGPGCYPLPGNGWLRVGPLPAGDWRVAYRQGGERMRVPGRGQRDLKRLLQERQIPVFLRNRLPLLFDGGRLVAVGGVPELAEAGAPAFHWLPAG